jgi:drug/metabolite transporter (DMT)-like permease
MSPVVLAFLSAILFGAASPLGKILLGSFPAFALAGLLYLGAALGLCRSAVARGANRPWRMQTRNRWRLLGAIVFGGIAAPVCLLLALQLASASSVSMWLILEAVFTALVAFLIFHEHLGRAGWTGVAGCIVASLLVSWNEGASGGHAALLVAAACLFWAIDNNLTAVIDGLTPGEIAFWKGTVAGTVNLSIAMCLHQLNPTVVPIALALLVGAFSYGLSLTLYIKAAQALGAARSQMIFATAPLWGVLFSMVLLHEPATLLELGSAITFGASIWLLFRDQHSHSHTHAQMSHVHTHTHDDGHHTHAHEGEPASLKHSHWHTHEPITHSHSHWPDLHHRHDHGD